MPFVLAFGCSGGDTTSLSVAPAGDVPGGGLDGGVMSARDGGGLDGGGGGFDAIDPRDGVASVDDAGEQPDDAPPTWSDLPFPGDGDPGPEPALPTARTQPDPCVDFAGERVMYGTDGDDTLTGGPGRDIIFGGNGDDLIDGGGGNDVLCGGNGEDHIIGGDGEDYIDGGYGNDLLEGGELHDVIHGRAGSDVIRGGPGPDLLFGDLLDDDVYGEGGNDILIGGHGNDFLHGGDNNDFMRGDTGHDTFVGGTGTDTVSFSTAMPTGQALNDHSGPAPEGVIVDFNEHLTNEDSAWIDLHDNRDYRADEIYRAGVASGDGAREALMGIENVIGSHFNDTLISSSAVQKLYGLYGDDALRGPAATMVGGPGADTCNDVRCDPTGEPPGRGAGALVFVDGYSDDTGIGVIGATGVTRDHFTVVVGDGSAIVTSGAGELTPGTGCRRRNMQPEVVVCTLPRVPLYLMAFGGDGDDHLSVVGGVPRDFAAHMSGGNGDDDLFGSAGDDVLFSGPTGRDTLAGNSGDDALLSESPAGMDPMTRGEAYPGGRDELDGGGGNDQLVSDYPCGHHSFVGGGGIDIAGFRRSTGTRPPFFAIYAQLGGPSSVRQDFHGQAFNPMRCAREMWATRIADDLEILEGADGDDHLFGDNNNNVIWGWGGEDQIFGYGGNDELWGHKGNDELNGGEGRDMLYGGQGFDLLHARDGAADARLDCGPENGRVEDSDPADPTATRCN